jgi:hypothetical protein
MQTSAELANIQATFPESMGNPFRDATKNGKLPSEPLRGTWRGVCAIFSGGRRIAVVIQL